MALTKVPSELSSTPSIVDGGNATAITITSDEDLLVGKSSLDVATVGHELRASGYSAATRDGATVGSFTRLNSDGTILEFRKSSAAVGSIGTTGSNVVIGTGNTGLRFYDGGSAIIPHTAAGGSSNGLVDLGQGGFNAFKDLYLSGGAYLGGTAAANKLDQYESGTWSPTISGCTITVQRAHYLKIGGLVHLSFTIDINSTDNSAVQIAISGAPFTGSVANSESTSMFMASNVDFPSGTVMANLYRYSRSGDIAFYVTRDNASLSSLLRSTLTSSSQFWGSIVMQTDD